MLRTWVVIDWPIWHKPVGTVHNTCLNQDILIESLLKWVFNFRAPLTPIWILFDCEKTDGGDGQGGRSDWLGTKGWWSLGLVVKNPPVNAGNTGDPGSIPGAGRYSGGGPGNRLQYSNIPVFLPGESHEQRSLESYSLWGCKEWTWLSMYIFPPTSKGTKIANDAALRKKKKKTEVK